MEEVDKGCLMTRMGVSGWMFLLVPADLGVCVCVVCENVSGQVTEMASVLWMWRCLQWLDWAALCGHSLTDDESRTRSVQRSTANSKQHDEAVLLPRVAMQVWYRERKCADTTGSLGWPFTMLKCKCIFQIKYKEAILSNSTRKQMLIAVLKNK